MKLLTLIFLLSLTACGPESSPEGRMGIKLDGIKKELQDFNKDKIQKELDSLKKQHAAILDSIKKINQEIRELKLRK